MSKRMNEQPVTTQETVDEDVSWLMKVILNKNLMKMKIGIECQ